MESPLLTIRSALIFFVFASLIFSSTPSPQELQIVNADRRGFEIGGLNCGTMRLVVDVIDLSSHIVRVFLTLKVENTGTSPASEVLLAFPPTQLPDAPNGAKFFSVSLLNQLNAGETVTLEILYTLTHSLEPFPEEISQSEPQLVYFRDSAIILSPYHIKEQTTFIKTPSTKVESYTVVEPTNRANTELKYGQYNDRAPYSYSPIIIHFENNHPFAVVEELLREVEISHWGSIQITEHYKLVHAGARHKGVFSRLGWSEVGQEGQLRLDPGPQGDGGGVERQHKKKQAQIRKKPEEAMKRMVVVENRNRDESTSPL
ncbi:hypothetical protein Scep_004978 [Stephania cephalantha]|uniref:Dolichyl-diphosphooligosaccharide--protein glycosyltransferase subunit 1 n=1 Tax=Stephania cephalantha TaxID=152367 RepID=A0AAP0KV20_9MAGN